MSYRRSKLAQAAFVPSFGLAALALLGLVLAYWTWAWLGPREAPRIDTGAEPAGRIAAAGGLFGKAAHHEGAGAQTGLSIRLLGVVAATAGRPGVAVVQLDAKQAMAVREGGLIAPGLRLEAIFADHVTLERGGVHETLALATRGAPMRPPVPGASK